MASGGDGGGTASANSGRVTQARVTRRGVNRFHPQARITIGISDGNPQAGGGAARITLTNT